LAIAAPPDGFGGSEPVYEHAAGWKRFLGWLQSHLKKGR
jgi:hypothetical protein